MIYSHYLQNFRACVGGNLITPSRTRPSVGARRDSSVDRGVTLLAGTYPSEVSWAFKHLFLCELF